ncbi:14711_t:CDS:2 [Dentiscutata heterogama]|uniref:14711_t:CDS:1 n=1 Tax=Dentiscutata heterogama TaxID=1316150 RepID=A0ACA9M5P5_9GLOM|nr:14711_t:CDS:2 [Dentiscutata heterogama]
MSKPVVYEDIPIIDISQFKTDQQTCVQQTKDACENLGFFYVKNHGISQEKIAEIFDISKLYFEQQPQEAKLKYSMNERYHGYAAMCTENLDTKRTNGDVKESFTFGEFNDNNEAITQVLPPFFEERAEFIASFYKDCHDLCLKIFQILATALEIPQSEGGMHWLEERHRSNANTCMRFHHYPSMDKFDSDEIRAGSHTDYGSITILFQKDIGGLEIQPPGTDKWFPVPIIPNHLLINIADCLSFWTKGLFKSIMHRVSFDNENFGLNRYSIAYFCIAGPDVKLDPIPSKFIPTSENNKDEKVLTAGEHLMRRARAAYGSGY